jgi:thiosulfate dehydrogenase (quinone) large subunit
MESNHKQTAFFLLRITIGLNFLGHGLARLPKINEFRNWMLLEFQNSILPQWSISIWGSILPILEFSVGVLLLLGLFTYRAAIIGAILIALLVLGSCLIEKWEWAGTQMLYAMLYYFMISHLVNNKWSMDEFLKNRK